MLDYLVGADWTDGRLTLAPHVPAGWPSLRATGLRLGELRYDLEARAFDEGLIVTLSGDLPTVDVDLTLHGEQPIRVVWINGSRRGVGEASAVLRLDDLQWEGDEPLEVVAVY